VYSASSAKKNVGEAAAVAQPSFSGFLMQAAMSIFSAKKSMQKEQGVLDYPRRAARSGRRRV
jgi:hypothetical protein